MKKIAVITAILGVAILQAQIWSLDQEESEEIRKTIGFSYPLKPKSLFIDNVFGYIHVKGGDGNQVILRTKKTIKARSRQKIERACREVKLEISEKDNAIEIFVDGPFRCPDRSLNWNCEKTGYMVQYDFDIQIPRKTDIFLKTVNNGDIEISHLIGHFIVKNVNGKIRMSNITGSGRAHTVNGEVKVRFDKNPKASCSFQTVNGDIEIFFPHKPSADFLVKTFNGEIYSAYDVRILPMAPTKPERINGRFVYKNNRFSALRVGDGGTQIKMDTLNGDIIINQK
ncbi:MAG: DUF4097 family beta strand repeat protein [Candidatus Aminicenantes bacterium]|nr:DUF4097 family beta strand repeat protein [Candidatus Aminicenantes bacterium]